MYMRGEYEGLGAYKSQDDVHAVRVRSDEGVLGLLGIPHPLHISLLPWRLVPPAQPGVVKSLGTFLYNSG